ncbi:hypothetical protein FRC08_001633 [Ceratobasidium sp. 394]|nr:hypothetical protein FRC08_001633 [Ceratobasidium sp. 394]KAG9090230.1 hypothetical protein FS749_000729 [Ceratobasidium sp. UAMH 11750]
MEGLNAQLNLLKFPAPPAPSDLTSWPLAVLEALEILEKKLLSVEAALLSDDGDLERLRYLSSTLESDCLPLLMKLEATSGLPESYIESCFFSLTQAAALLEESLESMNSTPILRPAGVVYTSFHQAPLRGRPPKLVDPTFLADALSPQRKISKSQLARSLGMDRKTLNKNIKASPVPLQTGFSPVTPEELDRMVEEYKEIRPSSGIRFVSAHLRNSGFKIQRHLVRDSLAQVDGLATELRKSATVQRRTYVSSGPGRLWHGDGHHKLIRWGFVIHGFVDGYDRSVTGLRAADNNQAATVLELFKHAIKEFGCPSRCRGDRGGENLLVALYMIQTRGPNRASFLWGSSTHNQRIERLWVDVGAQFARRWRVFFARLEELHRLQPNNSGHLWLLSSLFLDELNEDCRCFQLDWNSHGVGGPQMRGQTPNDMRLLAQLEQGLEQDLDDEPMDPQLLQEFYGVYGEPTSPPKGTSGAGASAEDADYPPILPDTLQDKSCDSFSEVGRDRQLTPEESFTLDFLRTQLQQEQAKNVRHPPVRVPAKACPFEPEQAAVFWEALLHAEAEGFIPSGYGIEAGEWAGGVYPELETLKVGRRKNGVHSIVLPKSVWFPRAVRWARALHIMNYAKEG